MNAYIWKAHAIARERQALWNYRAARLRFLTRGVPGAHDGYFVDALRDRTRWMAYRDLLAGIERAVAELERAEAAA